MQGLGCFFTTVACSEGYRARIWRTRSSKTSAGKKKDDLSIELTNQGGTHIYASSALMMSRKKACPIDWRDFGYCCDGLPAHSQDPTLSPLPR